MHSEVIHRAYQRNKRITILIAFVLSAVIGPFALLSNERSLVSRILSFVTLLTVSLIVFCWCYFDSLQRNVPITNGLRLLIIFFGAFTLCYYLIKSRGLKKGALLIGISIVIFGAAVITMAVSATIVQIIFDIPDPY